MDWFSLLLIFAFIVLPIIQQFIEQARKGREGRETEELDPAQVETRRSRIPAEEGADESGTGWSGEWAPWPGTEAEEPDEVDAPFAGAPAPFERSREARAIPPIFERLADSVPVPIPELPSRTATAAPALHRRAPRQRPRMGPGIVRTGLRNPPELRRSIVLMEVLGPPIALRHPGGGVN